MKRDDDLLRQMLLEFEADEGALIFGEIKVSQTPEERKWQHHLELLTDQGFMRQVSRSGYRLTSQGHDYLAAIRDEGIWAKTKAVVAETGGSATIEIIKALAVGLLKKQVSQRTGIEL